MNVASLRSQPVQPHTVLQYLPARWTRLWQARGAATRSRRHFRPPPAWPGMARPGQGRWPGFWTIPEPRTASQAWMRPSGTRRPYSVCVRVATTNSPMKA